jgi:hypothetical protein
MIPGAALAQWLGPRGAAAQDLVDAAAATFSLAADGQARARADRDSQARPKLIDAARRFMDRTGEIDAIMRELIATSRQDPFFRPPFHPLSSEVHNSLLLYHHPDLSISLGVTGVEMLAAKKIGRRGPASINFTGFVTLLRFLEAGSATISFWEAPPIADEFQASQAGHCRLVDRRIMADGEEICRRRHQSFVIEHASDDILFFQAVARAGCTPVGAEYDSDSLAFLGANSTDEASSRLQMMVSLLRAQERDDAFPIFEEALAGAPFYTRWHIMREMLAMDADAALPALRRMAEHDPHPDIRAAARSRWNCSSRTSQRERAIAAARIDAPTGDRIELAELVERLETGGFDSQDEDNFASWGAELRKLANDRNFLAELMIAELKQRCEGQVRDNQYSAQVIMLHNSSRRFIIRANFWPALKDSVIRHSGTDPFFYGVPHDHNFSFLTVGYFGPGYWSEYYEYDYDTVVGIPGEEVDLRFIEKSRLEQGKVMLYRAHRDVHLQLPADEMSVSINIVEASHSSVFRDQYRFDVANRKVDGILTHSPRVMLRLPLWRRGGAGPDRRFRPFPSERADPLVRAARPRRRRPDPRQPHRRLRGSDPRRQYPGQRHGQARDRPPRGQPRLDRKPRLQLRRSSRSPEWRTGPKPPRSHPDESRDP